MNTQNPGQIKVKYQEVQIHSRRGRSWAVKVTQNITVEIIGETAKALQFRLLNSARVPNEYNTLVIGGATCWVPKSAVNFNDDGDAAEISSKFVRYAGWPQWKTQVQRSQNSVSVAQ